MLENQKFIFIIYFFVGFLMVANAEIIEIKSQKEIDIKSELPSTPKTDDVKFIIESLLDSTNWNPGESNIVGTNQKLLEYDTTGLKLYTLKGKINIFDTDVLNVEKYGTFERGQEQKKLLKQRKYNKNSAVEGLNISLRAFLIFKYFYLYEYDFLDDIEYQYDYYNFYAKAINNIDAIYWWGKSEKGEVLKDYVNLPKGSLIELTTEFNEHRLYIFDFKKYMQKFYLDSLKVGLFSTYWMKESFVGRTNQSGTLPIIQTVLLQAKGVSLKIEYTIKKIDTTLKLRYNYGINNFVVVSNGHYNANYQSVDFLANYRYDIYNTSKHTLFTKADVMYSAKWFDNAKYTLDTEKIFSVGLSLGVIF